MKRGSISLLFVCLLLGVACVARGSSSGQPETFAYVRVQNEGPCTLRALKVHFPHEEVWFGDVPSGSTTTYHAVTYGVFEDAPFSYSCNGVSQHDIVMDFVGWRPLKGSAFTYRIRPRWEVTPREPKGKYFTEAKVQKDY